MYVDDVKHESEMCLPRGQFWMRIPNSMKDKRLLFRFYHIVPRLISELFQSISIFVRNLWSASIPRDPPRTHRPTHFSETRMINSLYVLYVHVR